MAMAAGMAVIWSQAVARQCDEINMGTGMKTKMQTRKHMHKSMCVTMDVDKAAAVTMAMPTDMIMRACHGRHRGHDHGHSTCL